MIFLSNYKFFDLSLPMSDVKRHDVCVRWNDWLAAVFTSVVNRLLFCRLLGMFKHGVGEEVYLTAGEKFWKVFQSRARFINQELHIQRKISCAPCGCTSGHRLCCVRCGKGTGRSHLQTEEGEFLSDDTHSKNKI